MIARDALVLSAATLNLAAAPPDMLATPTPVLAQAYANYKFAGPAPLPLREARQDWDGLRARVAREPAVARWVAARQRALDSWMALPRDDAAWIAGWGHDLIDPQTGRPLHWMYDMPEPPRGSAAADKLHGAWVYNRRSNNIRATQEAARLWRLTGDTRYRNWAAAQLDFYAANYMRWPERLKYKAYSRMMGQSLDEATNGIMLADAMQLLGNLVAPDRRRQWHEELFAPLLANLERSNLGRNNISVWQASAAAVLAMALDNKAALDRALNAENGVRAMLRKGVQADFTWFEPSLGYTNYTLRALSALFLQASLNGRGDNFVRERLLTQDMIASLLAVRFADKSVPALGDTSIRQAGVDPGLLALSQQTMPLRVGELPLSWETLLDPVKSARLPEETASRVWKAAQFAMLRAGGTELFTHWGQRNASHAQQDALSWEAHIGGTTVTRPAGVANYGSRLFLTYLRTAAAHNMPVINGAGQQKPGPGRLIAHDTNVLTAQASGFAAGAQVTRRVMASAATVETRTNIRPQGGGNQRLGEIFHTQCDVTPELPLRPSAVPKGDGFNWWQETRASEPSTNWRAMLTCDGVKVGLVWHADRVGRVRVSRGPDATGALNRTALYFETDAPALTTMLRLTRR
ncbi:Alginate lyase [Sphingomonas sp. OV641]|uniref:alginate lyase family protein n=1 Tax=Sphingomonas sp. OV641 TaxID=1881068 RepID=UPI0008B585AB|nr:heparinase II/III family protein [Sphingomonas sp. OV641]SEJ21354.1 Alginate lyase [Sphingomonas sp. OV641]